MNYLPTSVLTKLIENQQLTRPEEVITLIGENTDVFLLLDWLINTYEDFYQSIVMSSVFAFACMHYPEKAKEFLLKVDSEYVWNRLIANSELVIDWFKYITQNPNTDKIIHKAFLNIVIEVVKEKVYPAIQQYFTKRKSVVIRFPKYGSTLFSPLDRLFFTKEFGQPVLSSEGDGLCRLFGQDEYRFKIDSKKDFAAITNLLNNISSSTELLILEQELGYSKRIFTIKTTVPASILQKAMKETISPRVSSICFAIDVNIEKDELVFEDIEIDTIFFRQNTKEKWGLSRFIHDNSQMFEDALFKILKENGISDKYPCPPVKIINEKNPLLREIYEEYKEVKS